MRLYPETDTGRAWFLLILGSILVSGYFSVQWIINNVPLIAFHPACRTYFRVPPQTIDDLHLIYGDLSDEAWELVRESYGEDLRRFEENGFIKITTKKFTCKSAITYPMSIFLNMAVNSKRAHFI